MSPGGQIQKFLFFCCDFSLSTITTANVLDIINDFITNSNLLRKNDFHICLVLQKIIHYHAIPNCIHTARLIFCIISESSGICPTLLTTCFLSIVTICSARQSDSFKKYPSTSLGFTLTCTGLSFNFPENGHTHKFVEYLLLILLDNTTQGLSPD